MKLFTGTAQFGKAMRYGFFLVIALAFVAGVECSTDEDIITMVTILVAAGLLGWVNPTLFFVSGLGVGLVVPAVALYSQATGWHPSYETSAQAAQHGPGYAASLLFLVLPAMLAAAGAAWFGKTNKKAATRRLS